MQIISSLISLEYGNIENEEAIKALSETRRRIEVIILIHQKLYQNRDFSRVYILSYIEDILAIQRMIYPTVNCIVKSPDLILDLDTAVPLGLIISEMITNSLKHAFINIEAPKLEVPLSMNNDVVELLIKDNGVGLSESFDLNQPESLGIEIVTALIDQIGGRIECFNNEAYFKINFQYQPLVS
jgi:two-component sensor histidine kinase